MKLSPILSSSILLIFSISFALVIGEGFLRLKNLDMKNYDIEMWKYAKDLKIQSTNPILGHEHVLERESLLQSVNIRINNFGMRGENISQEKSLNRILFLGSSITLGWGVNYEETTPTKLKGILQDRGYSFEVLNGGIGNYNAVRYTELFFTKLKSLNPDKIIIQYFVNDAERLESGGGNWLLRNSQLAVTLLTAFNRVINAGNQDTLVEHYKKVYSDNSLGFIEMKNALKKISTYAHANNIDIYLLMTPDFHNLENYSFDFIHSKMENVAKENEMRFIDLLPYLEGIPKDEIWAMPGDPHPNSRGHEIMAVAIADSIKI